MIKNLNLTVGIIGRGNFSLLLLRLLKDEVRSIKLIGRDSSEEERLEVLKSDIVIIGVTLGAYPQILDELKQHLNPESLLVDVCSVKVKPLKLIKDALPDHKNLLITHPLFGPQSAAKGTEGLKLILCDYHGDLAEKSLTFCRERLRLNIVEMSADEHDKAMAYTHALTFFISETLRPFKLSEHGIKTPSFEELLDLSRVTESETPELLESIQHDNPYAQEVRDKFADEVDKLRDRLDS